MSHNKIYQGNHQNCSLLLSSLCTLNLQELDLRKFVLGRGVMGKVVLGTYNGHVVADNLNKFMKDSGQAYPLHVIQKFLSDISEGPSSTGKESCTAT
jgi:hypothetical protein